MSEKREAILKKAIHLFATDGFHPTSIQDICTISGISKGAFYLHFRSKDELLFKIYEYYYEGLNHKIDEVRRQALHPRESFEQQMTVHFQEVLRHRDFIVMQLQEQELSTNPTIAQFVREMKEQRQKWYIETFAAIYGEEFQPHIYDLSIMLDGITKSYLQTLLDLDSNLDPSTLAQFIRRRIDELAAGKKSPNLFLQMNDRMVGTSNRDSAVHLLEEIRQLLSHITLTEQKREQLLEAISVIEAEFEHDQPRKIIIDGMLRTMDDVEGIEFYCKRLKKVMRV
ncbi:LOW QUALITY PROTEIN: transcriptional regulator, TetR family [Geomicrobium sp. JCM 19037]|nr:LOW QUALITY PROTEIN: transcriptional regulator, TetR family [Geomicrobium sp. JCM 19037]